MRIDLIVSYKLVNDCFRLQFALVKWVGKSKDSGKFSVVDSSWISGNLSKQYPPGTSQTVVIQLKTNKASHPGGYTCFDAIVLKLSGKYFIKVILLRLTRNEETN